MEYPDEIHSLNNTRTHIQPGLTESPSSKRPAFASSVNSILFSGANCYKIKMLYLLRVSFASQKYQFYPCPTSDVPCPASDDSATTECDRL